MLASGFCYTTMTREKLTQAVKNVFKISIPVLAFDS